MQVATSSTAFRNDIPKSAHCLTKRNCVGSNYLKNNEKTISGLTLALELIGYCRRQYTCAPPKPLEVMGVKQMPDGGTTVEAVTSISGAEARRLGIEAPKGISLVAPNFYMPDYGSRMTSSIYVRGLGARIDQPIVGLTIDNIPYLNKDNYDFDVVDIENIEVLRGAQSVLNGRNTMGGG